MSSKGGMYTYPFSNIDVHNNTMFVFAGSIMYFFSRVIEERGYGSTGANPVSCLIDLNQMLTSKHENENCYFALLETFHTKYRPMSFPAEHDGVRT